MEQVKSLAASWARSFLAAALALYMAGVTDPLIARLCKESNLIDQIRHDIGLPAFACKVAVNIDGAYPSLCIWIMIRLTRSVSCIADPAVRSSISTWECIIYLLTQLNR